MTTPMRLLPLWPSLILFSFVTCLCGQTASNWLTQLVDPTGSTGWRVAMALDNDGHHQICYQNQTFGHLPYAAWDGARWKSKTWIIGQTLIRTR